MLFLFSWLQKKLNVQDLPDTPAPLVQDPSEDIFYGFFKNKNLRHINHGRSTGCSEESKEA